MQAVSDWLGPISGSIFKRSAPSSCEVIAWRRACIQLTLPRTVLISPLWHRNRYGWARRHDGKGVGRKALVDQGQGRDRQRIAQIPVKAADLRRQQQALKDEGARRERRHVKIAQRRHAVLLGQRHEAVQGLLADGQDLALERILIGDPGTAGDDRLADPRHGLDDPLAEPGGVGRHIAPADEALTLRQDEMLEMADGDRPGLRVGAAKSTWRRHSVRAPAALNLGRSPNRAAARPASGSGSRRHRRPAGRLRPRRDDRD